MTAQTVHALIEAQAAQRPQAIYALSTEGGSPLPYDELARGCRSVAAVLRQHGAKRGDTVSLVMPNGLQTLRVLLGAMHAGLCVNPVNLLSQAEQMRYVLAHSDCRLVCVAPDWEERVRAMLQGIERPVSLMVVDPDASALPGEAEAPTIADTPPPAPEDPALLMYTSGTTGMPKGVMLSQRSLAANANAISAEHGLGPADRVLAVLPLYHINAFAVIMLAPLAHGGSLAMPPKFSAGRFWEQAAQAQCSWINVVPTMISYLLEGEMPPPAQTAGIRFCRSASAALPPEHHRAFEQMFGIGIVETMGLTETAAPSFSNPMEPAKRKLGSVGRASGCEARVIDTQLAEVPDGTTGELAIRGPNVMLGYYKNEEATRASFTPDGWLRTGDLGHRDADGFFFVTGRIKELIIKGGENIAPREIDEALLAHPAVRDAAAVGVPDRHYGQEIGVCVILREGSTCTEEELRAYCAGALGRYKAPGHYRFVEELPRGPSGKVQRLKLLPLFE
ncbi:long-chain fatty acid--CoA ligase [Variovorax sp. WS11]|uniref:AMP-binding protein n=1 Tax=Variovorax sp. WS11 TaxID=1105204 RepID=UPI000D0DA469|nr:AMP-binding protein [Variovorax sp. WS11]NDZ15979.1 AMP-binding protein [Variovorax sp. WS11]PSL81422.1 long-chain fatty acid--CoA ligase [Variovorax sp. WS11]